MAKPFYRYTDDSGRVFIVDGMDRVPPRYRDGVEPVSLDNASVFFPEKLAPPPGPGPEAPGVAERRFDLETPFGVVDGPSFGAGFALATVAFVGLMIIRSNRWRFMGGLVRRMAIVGWWSSW